MADFAEDILMPWLVRWGISAFVALVLWSIVVTIASFAVMALYSATGADALVQAYDNVGLIGAAAVGFGVVARQAWRMLPDWISASA